MQFDVITLFPDIIKTYCNLGIVGRGHKEDLIKVNTTDLRPFGLGKHNQVDDLAYGGGVGLILMLEPLYNAIKSIERKPKSKVLITSASGKKWDQKCAERLKESEEQLIIICGRYEGYDERVLSYVDEEICMGDFILSGGEICALTIIDTISRLVPGVLRKEETHDVESFENGLLEYPQYTRPQEFNDLKVPDVLISGHHGEIKKWREEQSRLKTEKNRPDLLK